jgi:hypothetical protein
MSARSEALATPAPSRRVETAPRAAPRRRPRTSTSRRPGIVGGVVWIGALAALLAGIVALNVAVLQLNVRLDSLGRDRASLRSTNASLAAQLSTAAATPQLEALAEKRLGLVQANPEETTYLDLIRR